MSSIRSLLTLLTLLLVVVLVAYLAFLFMGAPSQGGVEANVESYVPGPPSPEVVEMLEKSRGFEALVSYTENGFEPREVTIAAGESIRFTNNSQHELWVASGGTTENPVYPGTSECGGSVFDSCRVLSPREFWEFTFERGGTWLFQNNLDKEQSGAVIVHVES